MKKLEVFVGMQFKVLKHPEQRDKGQNFSGSRHLLMAPYFQAISQFAQAPRCALTTVPDSCLFGTSVVSTGLAPSRPQISPGCQSTPSSASSSSTSMSHPAPPVFTAEHFRFPVPAQ